MTTVDVRKVHCDRCKRVEERPLFEPVTPMAGGVTNLQPQTWVGTTPTPAFTALILEEGSIGTGNHIPAVPRKVEFVDLCKPCQRTVAALLEQIGKKIDGLSPERAPRVAKKKEAASSSKAASPNHSAASGSASGNGLRTGMRSS